MTIISQIFSNGHYERIKVTVDQGIIQRRKVNDHSRKEYDDLLKTIFKINYLKVYDPQKL